MAKRRKLRADTVQAAKGTPVAEAPARRFPSILLTCLLAAAVLTGVAAAMLVTTWHRLPAESLARLDWHAVGQTRAGLSGKARAGFVLVVLSEHLTRGLHNPDGLPAAIEDARAGIAELRETQVGRLQLAALTMLRLQREGVPSGAWWPSLRTYLDGLEHAPFDHCLPELLEADAQTCERLGLGPGSARRAALLSLGHAHGPFLQLFVEHTRGVADELRRAGDEVAATQCDHVVRRLLRTWVLEPGPAGLRLLAADLLANALAGDGSAAGMADKCRGWRAAYRTAAASLPKAPALLRVGEEPTGVSAAPLTWTLAWAAWTAAAVAGAGVVALTAAVFGLGRGHDAARWRGCVAGALLAVVAISAGGIGLIAGAGGLVWDDFQRADARDLGVPRLPIFGATAGFVLAAAVGGFVARRGGSATERLAGVARCTAITWLVLSGVALATTVAADRLRGSYESAMASPVAESLGGAADANERALLDALRGWNP